MYLFIYSFIHSISDVQLAHLAPQWRRTGYRSQQQHHFLLSTDSVGSPRKDCLTSQHHDFLLSSYLPNEGLCNVSTASRLPIVQLGPQWRSVVDRLNSITTSYCPVGSPMKRTVDRLNSITTSYCPVGSPMKRTVDRLNSITTSYCPVGSPNNEAGLTNVSPWRLPIVQLGPQWRSVVDRLNSITTSYCPVGSPMKDCVTSPQHHDFILSSYLPNEEGLSIGLNSITTSYCPDGSQMKRTV